MRFLKTLFIAWFALAVSGVVAAFAVRRSVPEFGGEDDAQFSIVAAMDGKEFSSRSADLLEGRATAFMGGIELDLTESGLAPGAYLTLRATMGGIDLIVPPSWRVEVMGRTVMGGIGNITDPDDGPADGPLLLVDALAVMGGIEIHASGSSDGG